MIIKNIILKYKIYFIVSLILIVLISVSSFKKGSVTNSPIIADAKEIESNDNKPELDVFSVDIKGAVKSPGVYKVVSGSNVSDVIELAGGLKSNATTNNINLSKKVSDEMVIYIYTKSEYNNMNSTNTVSKVTPNECKGTSKTPDISNCISNDATIITSDVIKETTINNQIEDTNNNVNGLVNINTASKEELMTITGIGESKADCIISYRLEVGLFNTIEDIKNVSGIGDALFNKIKDSITV